MHPFVHDVVKLLLQEKEKLQRFESASAVLSASARVVLMLFRSIELERLRIFTCLTTSSPIVIRPPEAATVNRLKMVPKDWIYSTLAVTSTHRGGHQVRTNQAPPRKVAREE